MIIPFLGELAALGTSVMFSIGPTYFTLSGRLVGSVVVNRTRLLMATLILLGAHALFFGELLPMGAEGDRWFWLGLSGVIGLTLGDAALFQAFIQLGARLTMLVFSLSPVMAAFLAWLLLGEKLGGVEMLGMGVTIAGVLWVVSENQNGNGEKGDRRLFLSGLFFAFLGMLGQASGLVTAKLGLYGDFSALSGQVMRMLAGTVAIWFVPVLRGQVGKTLGAFRKKPKAAVYITTAVIFGPVIGVYLSLVAVQFSSVGIASTLMALPPIFLIGIDCFLFKEKISVRAVVGTLLAMGGVGILFLF